ncbi:hypothetical protein JMJ77_0014149 [Colletotrichum scovillei]|uniref:Uncharacterized protein n=1 Tax=Colletotrichum scovillei TaxID=1209932 RepID=A0A9P7R2V5_9PEZI|nr:hypothetical protein JMJ77_0014149 [Colletotrichum scovillei]KAG7065704.1 hypothetical protein JMJ78_0012451 [Colletotrichum scovillei]KAG7068276.1 hypothetical protein JMJ76_0007966 [Colletotrichum scovillei]
MHSHPSSQSVTLHFTPVNMIDKHPIQDEVDYTTE